MATLTVGAYEVLNTTMLDLTAPTVSQPVLETTPTVYSLRGVWDWGLSKFYGSGLTYDVAGKLTGGVVTGWEALGPTRDGTPADTRAFLLEDILFPATAIASWLANGSGRAPAGPTVLLNGNDTIIGGPRGDEVFAGDGFDTISGGGGDDTLRGGAFYDDYGENYLRGDDGNDYLEGAGAFDDINGNAGNDTAAGGPGDDWVVGGKDNDVLYGDRGRDAAGQIYGAGNDIVYGNLGDDTCDGDGGNDIVRGGQGDDSVSGGTGDDWLSGDLGGDTLSGGAGADVFHSFGGAGLDRVTDFNRAEGDRVQLDAGTTYAVSQVGADTVIDMTGGGQLVLVGVTMASLTEGWIGAT